MSDKTEPTRNPAPTDASVPKNIFDLLEGDKSWDVMLPDVLNTVFVVKSIAPTRYASKDLAVCDVVIGGKPQVMLITSKTICDQLTEHQGAFPLACKVGRKGKRYRFVP